MPEPQPEGWFAGLLQAAKSLTFTNVVIIALLAIIAVPAYAVYSILNDPVTLERLMSSYSERTDDKTGCTIRSVKARGGATRWSISTGIAFQGSDTYQIAVVLPAEPDADDIVTYCAALGLIVNKLLFAANGHRP